MPLKPDPEDTDHEGNVGPNRISLPRRCKETRERLNAGRGTTGTRPPKKKQKKSKRRALEVDAAQLKGLPDHVADNLDGTPPSPDPMWWMHDVWD
jgi:hypothetical protein